MSSPAAVKSATEIRPSEQQLAAMYNAFKQDLTAISTKLGELEMEKEEHNMVINTLKDINNPDRTAFRLVGGVLVERTIGDVLPQVEGNMAGINSVITQIVATYKKKEEEFAQFTQKYNIQVRTN